MEAHTSETKRENKLGTGLLFTVGAYVRMYHCCSAWPHQQGNKLELHIIARALSLCVCVEEEKQVKNLLKFQTGRESSLALARREDGCLLKLSVTP